VTECPYVIIAGTDYADFTPSTNGVAAEFCGIHYSQHISNEKVRRETNQPLVTGTICARRLPLFGHVARASEAQDHSRVVRCAINKPPCGWKRSVRTQKNTWLRTVEQDLKPLNVGLHTAWRNAQDLSDKWRQCTSRATLLLGAR